MSSYLRLLTLMVVAVSVSGCQSESVWPDRAGPKVVVSFAPLYSFASTVAGDDAVVQTLMSTQGPHHFDPNPNQARLLYGADLFFVSGLGLEERTAQRMVEGVANSRLKFIELGKRIPEDRLLEGHCSHDHGPGHSHEEHEHEVDPHVWLGIDHAKQYVAAICEELKAIDPGNAANYERRAAEFLGRLDALKQEGQELLKGKSNRKFVSFHESLNYFADTFGLEIVEVIQKTPGREPTAKELDKLIETCVKNRVRVIAVEPQYSAQNSAARIVEQLKAKGVENPVLVEIDPLETANPGELSADWYEKKMRANLRALAEALN